MSAEVINVRRGNGQLLGQALRNGEGWHVTALGLEGIAQVSTPADVLEVVLRHNDLGHIATIEAGGRKYSVSQLLAQVLMDATG